MCWRMVLSLKLEYKVLQIHGPPTILGKRKKLLQKPCAKQWWGPRLNPRSRDKPFLGQFRGNCSRVLPLDRSNPTFVWSKWLGVDWWEHIRLFKVESRRAKWRKWQIRMHEYLSGFRPPPKDRMVVGCIWRNWTVEKILLSAKQIDTTNEMEPNAKHKSR